MYKQTPKYNISVSNDAFIVPIKMFVFFTQNQVKLKANYSNVLKLYI